MQRKIGIAYTTHNRREVLLNTLSNVRKYLPKDCEFIVVDDASEVPFEGATYRFDNNVGIAKAKNKCIELLFERGCTDFFLFDDDTYPLVEDWYKPYIESNEPHLMYIFKEFSNGNVKLNDTLLIYEDSKIRAFSHARGCMLYFKRICFDKVGGMNPIYGKWGFEHPELSCRIYNKGLTTFKYMDVVGSEKLIYSGDEERSVKSTVDGIDRVRQLNRNCAIYNELKETDTYIPFTEERNLVITTYLTSFKDPQRNIFFKADKTLLNNWVNSIKSKSNCDIIVLNDCWGDFHEDSGVMYIPTESVMNPYIQRWISLLRFLKETDYSKVFITDATDVIMLNNPFEKIKDNYIYVGDEESKLDNKWLKDKHRAPVILETIEKNKSNKLLNAGLVGGYREQVIKFISKMLSNYQDIQSDAHFRNQEDSGLSDMGIFNYTCYNNFKDKIKHGRIVNTPFKSYKTKSIVSWFAHK